MAPACGRRVRAVAAESPSPYALPDAPGPGHLHRRGAPGWLRLRRSGGHDRLAGSPARPLRGPPHLDARLRPRPRRFPGHPLPALGAASPSLTDERAAGVRRSRRRCHGPPPRPSDPPPLPPPRNEPLVYVVLGGAATVALVVSMRGLQPYLSAAGLFGFLYVVSAAFLAPRIGIALYVSAVTAGTLIGSVALDHLGAFGAEVPRVTLVRGLGLLALILGVVLVRGR